MRYFLIEILKNRGILCYVKYVSKGGKSGRFLVLRKANSTWLEPEIGQIPDSNISLLKAVLFNNYGSHFSD